MGGCAVENVQQIVLYMGLGLKGESWARERYLGVISILIVIETVRVDEIIHRQAQSNVMRERWKITKT